MTPGRVPRRPGRGWKLRPASPSLPPSLPLYQDTDTNPLAGCLPAFGQIPVFIALYKSVLNLALQDEIDQVGSLGDPCEYHEYDHEGCALSRVRD